MNRVEEGEGDGLGKRRATYGLCAIGYGDHLREEMLRKLRGGCQSEGEEAADPAREVGDVVAVVFEAPGGVDDLLVSG